MLDEKDYSRLNCSPMNAPSCQGLNWYKLSGEALYPSGPSVLVQWQWEWQWRIWDQIISCNQKSKSNINQFSNGTFASLNFFMKQKNLKKLKKLVFWFLTSQKRRETQPRNFELTKKEIDFSRCQIWFCSKYFLSLSLPLTHTHTLNRSLELPQV